MLLFMRTFLWMLFQGAIVAAVGGFLVQTKATTSGIAAGIVGMLCAALVTAIIFEIRLLPFRLSRLIARARDLLRRQPRGEDLSLTRSGRGAGQLPEQFGRTRIGHDAGDIP
jgi:hypothetical protein